MRPVRLEMAGFGAFRESTVIDFSDVDYVALVGPTGSGKSTVIDAMCFALYGSVPRYAHQGRVGYVVTSGAAEARVCFTFDAGGRRYTATRVVRRRPDGKAVTREARLEVATAADAGAGAGGSDVLAGSVTELDAAIAGPVLGMPFDHFTRCVVLPQGEFARFLGDKPRDRQDMLVSLLGLEVYGRMGKRANETASQREWEAGQLRAQVADRAAATPDAVAAVEEQLGRLEKLQDQLAAIRGEVETLEADAAAAAGRAVEAAGVAADLEAVRVPAGVGDAAARLAASRAALQTAEERRTRAGLAVVAADEAVSAADRALAEAGQRSPLEALLVRRQQAATLAAELVAARQALASATAAADAERLRWEAAEAERQQAEERLLTARAAKAAHTLAERLVPGEPCPVCLVPVAALPHHAPAPDLVAGKRALDEASERAALAERAATEADRVRVARQTTVDGLVGRVESLAAELAGQPDDGDISAALARIDAAQAALSDARQAAGSARREEAAARQAADAAARGAREAEAALAEVRMAFDWVRDSLAALGPPSPGRADLAADWAALAQWAAAAAADRRAVERAAAAEVARLTGAATDLLAAAVDAFREAGLGDGPPIAGPSDLAESAFLTAAIARSGTPVAGAGGGRESASARPADRPAAQPAARPGAVLEALGLSCARAEAEAEAKLTRLREMMAEAERLAAQAAAADREATVARSLARHLSAKGFERWVLAEVLDGLVARASVILHQLTSGAYSLATEDDGEFSVIDHRNADERRSAKTLSGGETFQASLALALALAEQLSSLAAAGAARIEATFIDEGFGTLDEETLETVASTIEALGGDDRLVGVVTHVPALAERVSVRLEVAKGPRTATVTKVVA